MSQASKYTWKHHPLFLQYSSHKCRFWNESGGNSKLKLRLYSLQNVTVLESQNWGRVLQHNWPALLCWLQAHRQGICRDWRAASEYRNDSNSRRSELFQVTQEIPILTRLVVHLHQTPRSLPYTGNTHGSHLDRGTRHAINSQVTEKEEKTRKNERRARIGSPWNHGNFLSTEHYPKHSLKLQLTSISPELSFWHREWRHFKHPSHCITVLSIIRKSVAPYIQLIYCCAGMESWPGTV